MAQKKKTPPKAAAAKSPAVNKATVAKAIVKPAAKVATPAARTMQPEKSASVTTTKSKAQANVSAPSANTKPTKPATVTAKVAAKAAPKVAAAVKPAAVASKVAAPVGKPVPMPTQAKKASPVAASPKKAAEAVQPALPVAPVQAVVAPVAKQAMPAQRAISAAVSKPAVNSKITAPMMARPVVPAAPVEAAAKKPVNSRHGFKTGEAVVYPAHGVGRIVGIEEDEIAGISLELFVIQFEKDKMTLRVPTTKLQSVGMRKLAEDGIVKKAMDTLKGRARIKRTMWSRRAQEYEAKINSGDLVAIAEVVRDLYRSEAQPEQSYSERQLYEAALDRMAREIAAVDKLDERGAMQRITEVLSKSAKGRRAAEEEAASAAEAEAADIKAA